MIEALSIQDAATFTSRVDLGGLKAVNLFYGANGTGKTTLSRVLADPSRYPTCTISWRQGQPLEPFVYNRDFVESSFGTATDLPGIFTLGAQDVQVQATLEAKARDRERARQNHGQFTARLSEKQTERARAWTAFEDGCWTVKKSLEGEFREALKGASTKAGCAQRVLDAHKQPAGTVCTMDDLRTRATTLLGPAPPPLPLLPVPDITELVALGSQELLKRPIVGRSDAQMAVLIQRLQASDWVLRGRTYHAQVDHRQCPFCQQPTPDTVREGLEAVFDRGFEQDMQALRRLAADYQAQVQALAQACREVKEGEARVASELRAAHVQELGRLANENLRAIKGKLEEPGRVLALEDLAPAHAVLLAIIHQANHAAAQHNALLADRAKQKARLVEDLWSTVAADAAKPFVQAWLNASVPLDKAIAGLDGRIATEENNLSSLDREIAALEQQVTGVVPTIRAINNLLATFGFQDFRLEQARRPGFYQVVRPDGSGALSTLSEGERTFLTFLYFYHLLLGHTDPSSVTRPRVVVIDDPISSLDSEILHVVSTLARKIIDHARDGSGPIRQVFVLTHNVYFHKEIAHRLKGGQFTWWLVQKRHNVSRVQRHPSNPVRSTYERLWAELADPDHSPTTVQNAMRRILETYFNYIGATDYQVRDADWPDLSERLIAQAMLSWLHDGSHGALGDDHAPRDGETVERYRDVFRLLFERMGHGAHYRMMMMERPPTR